MPSRQSVLQLCLIPDQFPSDPTRRATCCPVGMSGRDGPFFGSSVGAGSQGALVRSARMAGGGGLGVVRRLFFWRSSTRALARAASACGRSLTQDVSRLTLGRRAGARRSGDRPSAISARHLQAIHGASGCRTSLLGTTGSSAGLDVALASARRQRVRARAPPQVDRLLEYDGGRLPLTMRNGALAPSSPAGVASKR